MTNLQLEALINTTMHDKHIPGLACGVMRGYEMLHEGYYGTANLEHSLPVKAESVFEIASVTKLFTAQTILRLVQDGKLTLDATLGSILNDLPETWKPITVQQCLSHQSGIPSYTNPEAYWTTTRHDKTHAEILALVSNQPLNFEPGTQYTYDNTGYYLLGMVIEAVTGEVYGDVLRRLIFEPLGMTHTRANDYEAIIPNRVQGYHYDADQQAWINKPFYSTSNTFSAGIVVSTVRDLLTWCGSLYDDRILNAEMRNLWWTPHISSEANERAEGFVVGLGWFQVESRLGPFLGHNGGIAGFASALLHFRESRTSAVVLLNADYIPSPHEIALDVIDRLGALG